MTKNAHQGIHPDALELAELLRSTWPTVADDIERSGAPTCLVAGDLGPQIAAAEKEVRELQEEVIKAKRDADTARKGYIDAGARANSNEFKLASAATSKLKDAEARLDLAKTHQIELLKAFSDGGGGPAGDNVWSAGRIFKDDNDLRDRVRKAGTTTARLGSVQLGEIASRESFKATVTGTANMRRGASLGVVPQLQRPLMLLDFVPTGVMDNNSLPYTQESGSLDLAAETTEDTAKPEAGVTYTDATADAATIAAYTKLTKQVLADVPALETVLDNRLRYIVMRRLELQVLKGNGTNPNLRGIIATTGIGTVPTSAGRPYGEGILSGITQVELADGHANAIVVNPSDWQTILTTKASGSGEYLNEIEPVAGPGLGDAGSTSGITVPSVPTLWGVPVLRHPAITAGTALVGDFAQGVQLFIREGVNVLVSDADGTDFTNNRVTILAETRAAVAVFRPTLFSLVTY